MIKQYRYETHLHTSPVSKCARASARENVDYYKALGYDGIFVTNHFLDGNIDDDKSQTYEERIKYYFSDYEEATQYGREVGLNVFCGVELSYLGTDFLVYGLDKTWYLKHPEIMSMDKTKELALMMENGALIIQAHPFREANYINHIRLFPRSVHGIEIVNSSRSEFENHMAKLYAENYALLPFAGSDNHSGAMRTNLAGLCFERQIQDEKDFVSRVKNKEMQIFTLNAKDDLL